MEDRAFLPGRTSTSKAKAVPILPVAEAATKLTSVVTIVSVVPSSEASESAVVAVVLSRDGRSQGGQSECECELH